MTTRDRLAARFARRLLPVSDAIVRRWGTVSGTVRRDTGHPPPVIDTLLAATALNHDLSGDAERTRCAPKWRRRLQSVGG